MMVMMMLMVMMEIHYKTLKSEHIDETAWPGTSQRRRRGALAAAATSVEDKRVV